MFLGIIEQFHSSEKVLKKDLYSVLKILEVTNFIYLIKFGCYIWEKNQFSSKIYQIVTSNFDKARSRELVNFKIFCGKL